MAAPTPKNPSTTKATQTNMALSFTTANPDGYPIAYVDDVWDAVEQNTAMSDVMEGTGQYDQKTINEQLAGKIGSIDLSVFEKVINKVISISAQSTDVQYPTAKLLYDSLQALANVYAAKANTYTKTEVDNLIASISTVSFVVVATLPTTDIQTNVIYLVPSSTAQQQNIYDEYIYSNNAWEHIGSTAVDLSGYELKINKVTSISAQSTDNEYPSAKLLYDSLQALSNVFARIADLASVAFSGSYNDLSNKPTIPAAQVNSDWNSNSGVSQILNKPNVEVQGNKVTVLSPQNTDAQYPSAKAVYDCCAEVKEFLEDLDERVTRLEGFHYMITGAALQGTIVIELNRELYTYQVGSDHAYEFKYKEPIQTLDFRAANIVSVSFYDSDSLIGLVSCDELFKNCVELIAVDFANKTFGAVISATDMFAGCVSLTTLTCPNSESWKPDLDFSDCGDLTQASLESLIDNFLFSYSSGDHVITPNQTMWGRISHADQDSIIARATAKGWQLNVRARYNIGGTSNGSIVNITVDGTVVSVPVVSGVWNYGYWNTLSSISFANDTHVQTIDFSGSDGLSGITSLASAFSGCTALTSVVFTNCDLSNITAALGAFGSCSALANLTIPSGVWKPDVSFADSPLITYAEMLDIISGLYYYPSGTHTITWNASTWDSFSTAEQLNIIQAADLKGWDTNSVSNIYYIRGKSTAASETFVITFIDDNTQTTAAETITVNVDGNGDWEYEYSGKKIYSLANTWNSKTTITALDLTAADDLTECVSINRMCMATSALSQFACSQTFANVLDISYAFNGTTALQSIDLSTATFASATNADAMFSIGTSQVSSLTTTSIDLRNATFANITSAENMFYNQRLLSTFRLDSATFASLTNGNGMFYYTKDVALPTATFASLTNANGMFNYSLTTTLDLHNVTFANVVNATNMFAHMATTSIDLSSATFASATTTQTMFNDSTKLATIIIPNATFANVTNAQGMFAIGAAQAGNVVTTEISMPNATFASATTIAQIIRNQRKLTTLKINSATFANVTTTTTAFQYANLLASIDTPQNSTAILPTSTPTNASMDLASCPLNYASMLKVANWLSDLTGYTQHTVTFNTTAWANLSMAQQLIISNILTGKNWACNAVQYVYYVRGTSNNVNGQETFNIQYINDGAVNPSTAETVTCNVDANGDWEFSYTGKKIYSLANFSNQSITILSANFTDADDLNECVSIAYAFSLCTNITNISFHGKTLANVVNAEAFSSISATNNITYDLDAATFASVTNAYSMFYSAKATSLSLPSATFASVTNVERMFANTNIQSISLAAATFASVTNAMAMFNASKVESLSMPLATFASATTINSMFLLCNKLLEISMPSATFAAVTTARQAFNNDTSSLTTTINLPSAVFGELLDGYAMFISTALVTLNLQAATMAKLTSTNVMFAYLQKCTTINLQQSGTFPISVNFSQNNGGKLFTYQTILNLANWLKDLTGLTAQTITLSVVAWNALSSAEQATIQGIVSGKNWNLATA